MLPFAAKRRFLARLGAPDDTAERRRIERVLASARLFLASSCMLAIYLDPTEPTKYATLAYSLMGGYIVYSGAVWTWLHRAGNSTSGYLWIYALDMIFPAVFTLFTEGPNSPFFLFFVFVLTAAAFRWGLLETVATSGLLGVLLAGEAAILKFGTRFGTLVQGEYEVNRFVIRLSYLGIFGVLLGYLAEEEKQLRAESALVTRVIARVRLESGLRGTMQAVLGEMLRLFNGRRALAVLRQSTTGRIFLWHSERRLDGDNTIASQEVAPEQREIYTDNLAPPGIYAERRGTSWMLSALDQNGRRSRVAAAWSPSFCPEIADAKSLLGASFSLGDEWTGRLLLFDTSLGLEKLKELRFAQKLLRHIGPSVYTIYLLRRLRSRAGALERARVARELHDGAIQALIAVEMEVDVLRRQAAQPANGQHLVCGLEHIQELLREQVFDLRTLMQQMRPVDLKGGQFLDYVADIIERFRRETGIAAQFVSALEEVELSPRVGRELVRIVQEALVNVRKHSGARNVLVRFAAKDNKWVLAIDDDGRGFEFEGRMSLGQLDSARRGPGVIKERVRTLGGDMILESQPGRGSHLEVTLPQKAQVAYV